MPKLKDAAAEFLANKRIAVTGVSRTPNGHGGNVVYQRLKERGYQVFAVNPNAEEVEGDSCYPDLKSIPGGVDAVVMRHPAGITETTVQECAGLGIKHVWMHRSFGGGSVSAGRDRLRQEARDHGDRRRLPADVRAHLRSRAPGDPLGVRHDRQGPQAGMT